MSRSFAPRHATYPAQTVPQHPNNSARAKRSVGEFLIVSQSWVDNEARYSVGSTNLMQLQLQAWRLMYFSR
jgi:hypothetical protein